MFGSYLAQTQRHCKAGSCWLWQFAKKIRPLRSGVLAPLWQSPRTSFGWLHKHKTLLIICLGLPYRHSVAQAGKNPHNDWIFYFQK